MTDELLQELKNKGWRNHRANWLEEQMPLLLARLEMAEAVIVAADALSSAMEHAGGTVQTMELKTVNIPWANLDAQIDSYRAAVKKESK